ncbi:MULTISPECIES: hypothetical protein [Photobacterium]|uniref:hypothetical protein n=1 Tax=Photobacterium TaxID=657 RepID=UPI001C2DB60D|nr:MULTISPECIES: hypothetical protein [Photobacterium]MBV1842339.1 hypothetical protein [Photobacterium ganghwense]
MKYLIITALTVGMTGTVLAEDIPLGQSRNRLIQLQTIDPAAENRIPLSSPGFSGKKAVKSMKSEESGKQQESVKRQDLIAKN